MASRISHHAADDRAESRDTVFHRARATLADRRSVPITIVNLSPHGMMARIDVELVAGDAITLTLPAVGSVGAEVRWSLGGRIGCQFERGMAPRDYHALLAAIGG